jgi:peptidoglycan glycosyltransferase
MNRQIKALGVFLVLCYVALFVKLNQTQIFDADKLNADPNNLRPIQREFNRARGQIISADGVVLARSIAPTDQKDIITPRVREYPTGDLFGQITGYYSYLYGATGVEKTYNDALLGRTFDQQIRGFADLFSNNENVGNVSLTVNNELQAFARDNFKGPHGEDVKGAVVAIDPKTGAILAMWSNPSYDPTFLSTGTSQQINDAWALLNLAPDKPLVSKAFREIYHPGSTFKIVTGGIGLQTGKVTNDNPIYDPNATSYKPPQTNLAISNFGGETCGGALPLIMTRSCNSSFAQMGQDTIGAPDMLTGVQQWGFNGDIPLDLPEGAKSVFPTGVLKDPPKLAQASIGQNDTSASPLTMALVAAGAANGGTIMTPHVMRDIRNSEGQVVTTYQPSTWLTPMSPDQATILMNDLYGPVYGCCGYTGTAQGFVNMSPGYKAGGKTGTAQVDPVNRPNVVDAWFTGFAGKDDGSAPQVAVAAVVLDQGGANNDATGGQVAGPIVSKVMNKALDILNRQPK